METNIPKINYRFFCNLCNFKTNNKRDYNKHLLTLKHQQVTIVNNELTNYTNTNYAFECEKCTKEYKSRVGLWKHRKICNPQNISLLVDKLPDKDDTQFNKNNTEDLIQYLMKENSEFKQLIIDQNKQIIDLAKNSGSYNNNTTNNNNAFNLNFFLNETCKDAMNIMDFVNQLQLSINDLENTASLGFAGGISKIFINGLKNIDVNNRPLHCSDLKRETIYIKNDNQWNKDSDDKLMLTNAIKRVAHKNMKLIPQWTKLHPEFSDSYSKQNDLYLQIVSEAMSGSTVEETNKNYCKIVKNIVKEAVIEK